MTIVGSIHPSDEEGGRPTFKIVCRFDLHPELEDVPPNVRPCSHGPFVLDERWSTITCDECGERLEPFAVLMEYAEIEERLRIERVATLEHTCHMLRDDLRRLTKRQGITPDEVKEIEALTGWKAGGEKPDVLSAKMREVRDRIERVLSDRRWARKQARRSSRPR